MSEETATVLDEPKATRSRAKKQLTLTDAERKQLQASVAKAEEDIMNRRQANDDRDQWYKENSQRYRCMVTATGARKGEKTAELFYENPQNPDKPVKLNIKLGVWLEKGLPMYVIQRLQDAFDTSAEEREATSDPLASAGTTHIMGRTPRFIVRYDNKPIGA